MSLSDKIINTIFSIPPREDGKPMNLINVHDVKQFIKDLKRGIEKPARDNGIIFPQGFEAMFKVIDELAGEELI